MAYFFDQKIIYVLFIGIIAACSVRKERYTSHTTTINNSIEADSTYYPVIEPYQEKLEAKMNAVIGHAGENLVKDRPEGKLGNFIADLTLQTALDFSFMKLPEQRTFCLLNHGGLRAPISKGGITVGNVFEVMPFDNEVVVLKIAGDKVQELVEYIVERGGHPLAGMRIKAKKSADGWDIDASIQGATFEKDAKYYVITSDYLAQGGDDMTFFLNPLDQVKSGLLLRDAILNYVKKREVSITGTLDGRIKIFDDE